MGFHVIVKQDKNDFINNEVTCIMYEVEGREFTDKEKYDLEIQEGVRVDNSEFGKIKASI